MIAPVHRRGFVQGLNVSVMNVARAASPFLLGAFADAAGTVACMWTCVGISVLAALANLPLVSVKDLQRSKKKKRKKGDDSYYQKALNYEDEDLVDHIMQGHWVPAKDLAALNMKRYENGLPFLVTPIKPYEEDKACLSTLKGHAVEDFEFHRSLQAHYLSMMDTPEKIREVVAKLNESSPSEEAKTRAAEDLGRWFGDYAKDNGYFLSGGQSTLLKQMIITTGKAFPAINRDGGVITVENHESTVLRFMKVTNDYFEMSEPDPATKAFRDTVVM